MANSGGSWITYKGRRIYIGGKSADRKKLTRKQKEAEYELYKKAKENPNSIDPMTENSTDWEGLEKKYGERYKNEKDPKVNIKKDGGEWETKRYSEVQKDAEKSFGENQEKIQKVRIR